MNIKKSVFVVVGCISLALGTLGIVLPLLPTVPLYLLTAYCFARSSERLHTWFINTDLYKNNLESYVKGEGMTVKTKVRIMATVTAMMSVGFIMMDEVPVARMFLAAVWVFHVLYFVLKVKTIKVTE
ncbi:MAG: YbaN family protein [Oscillospiraceae bacterium]|nr:YbaN family protein [Oscillospiraceae bacterium]